MATAAFKSNSKRINGYGGSNTPKNPNPPPPKPKLRRSLSVNAISPPTQNDIVSEFLNKRDNPLYWATGGSPPAAGNTETQAKIVGASEARSMNAVTGQRGRSVVRSGGQTEEVGGRRRSLSRVNGNGGDGGNRRRGRSVSRARLGFGAYESEAEQDSGKSTTYGGRSSSIRTSSSKAANMQDKSRNSHLSRHPSVGSSFDSQVSYWEDGISTSSLSEAEEKTIKAVYEQMKSFKGEHLREDTASSEIYETVRSEVRRAIADIQDDLQHAIQRDNSGAVARTDVSDIPPDLVKPGAVELVLDIRREYAKELEESQERARKLRSDLAIEEHRRQELSRILKETLPEPKTSSSHRSRLGRKSSSERKKMSKRLTDEALSYFDECVSISTFDSSDFSAAEDPAINSVDTTLTTGSTSRPNRQMNHGDPGRKFRFSFGHKPTESMELQQDIKNYIKTFEKDPGINGIVSESSRTRYNVDAYDLLDVNESLLFDKVLFKTRQESGSLHICGGAVVPFLPFTHLF